MTRQFLIHTVATCFLVVAMCAGASADTIFFDDFSDGNADFPPAQWTPSPDYPGDYDASSGDYVFSPTVGPMTSEVLDITLTDFSIRSQVRTSADRGSAILTARNQNAVGDSQNYYGGIGHFEADGGTALFLQRNDPGGAIFDFGTFFFGADVDVRTDDFVLQLDVIGDRLKLWGWKAGDPMPAGPQISATDDTYSSGTMRIFNAQGGGTNNTVTFRFVQLADMHIPEPSTFALSALAFLAVVCRRMKRN